MSEPNLYENDFLRTITGNTIRPGGFQLTDRALDFCCFAPHAEILDAGCGTGATVEHLRKNYSLNANGIDQSAKLLSQCAIEIKEHLLSGSIYQLPFADGSFDGVFCECVLSILPRPENVLQEFHRVMRTEGRLVLTDIYLRNAEKRPYTGEGVSCFSHATSAEEMLMQIASSGFEAELWEDHSVLIKELAARFVLEHGSLTQFWKCFLPVECATGAAERISLARPGYYLLISRKTSDIAHNTQPS